MSEFKGTLGPWCLKKLPITKELIIENESGRLVAVAKGNIDKQANALLISKAPEMLEMLQDLLDHDSDISYQACSKIEKLIISATVL